MANYIISMKQYPCIESTIEFFYGDKLIRIWIDENAVQTAYTEHDDLNEKIMGWLQEHELAGPAELAKYIQEICPRVSALQFKDSGGTVEKGVVIYFTDFNS